MKKIFFLGIVGLAVLWGIGFFLYRIGQSLLDMYEDWELAKELKQIERESTERRREVAGNHARANPIGDGDGAMDVEP